MVIEDMICYQHYFIDLFHEKFADNPDIISRYNGYGSNEIVVALRKVIIYGVFTNVLEPPGFQDKVGDILTDQAGSILSKFYKTGEYDIPRLEYLDGAKYVTPSPESLRKIYSYCDRFYKYPNFRGKICDVFFGIF
ncbi:hypothetical protein VZ95_19915 [Elstera litoralis]|uniref:Uncharacterized protein n=1 Tax=Elstera litoralis TaxID=552518 RepID=A0A0F3IPQ2_9PROT|nr:hypothetical protein [Elstera litoralis]KJV07559.1 hypothetical protein VZ95_19915 [Elstera litoralis]